MIRRTAWAALTALFVVPTGAAATQVTLEQHGRQLVKKVVQAVGGGLKALQARRSVEYEYTYRKPDGGADLSIERYRFVGELSWGKYLRREAVAFPERQGTIVQGYDGKQTWMTVDGKRIDDPKALKMADFLRKTNLYWFAMMHKLLDPGTRHKYLGRRKVGQVAYELVELTFAEGVGDVQDKYLLYINPETHLVDQFLFTVMDFGRTAPYLMRVDYRTVDGLKLPATRRYAAADWEGKVPKEAKWTEEIMRRIRFGVKLRPELFKAPEE